MEIKATELAVIDATLAVDGGNSRDCIQIAQVRKIKPTRRSVSGVLAFRGESAKPYESTLERDFLLRAEFFNDVLDVVSQPVQIEFRADSGQVYRYTPDFLVYYKLGSRDYLDYPKPLLVEVKPESEWRTHWREWLPKWKAARRYAQAQGWAFHIVDESRIRDEALQNIRFLERYKRLRFEAEESEAVLSSVREMGSTPIHYLLARHFMGLYRAQGIAHLWHLIATRRLDCDVTQLLNDCTQVWISYD